jgi:nucleoside phosphorylase
MFISAGKNEIFDFAYPIGVGLIESAINLTKIILFNRPKKIIFIGSAGSYGREKIFNIIESSAAANIEHCMLKKECYTPIENIIVSRETKIVNSSNYITSSKSVADKFLKFGFDLENMEFFSVLKVAMEFNIEVKGIFVVTNYCFENAHYEYDNNIKKAKKLLEEFIKEKYWK